MPLTFGIGSPSGPNATAADLFTPFFFTPSVGGGIDDGAGVVSVGTGVLAESDLSSSLELGATGRVLDVDEAGEFFDGDSSFSFSFSSLTSSSVTGGGEGAKRSSALGERVKVTTRLLPLDDFRRAAEIFEGLFECDEAIAEDCWRWGCRQR